MKNRILFLFIFLNFFLIANNSKSAQEIKIVYKIDNSIITNIDLAKELNYLIALNNDLKKINKAESIEIAKNSIIREIIKKNEIKKFLDLENFDDQKLMNRVLANIYEKLNLNNLSEFENYLSSYGITADEVNKKMKIEVLWNQLIAERFNSQININEDEIRKKVKNESINYKNVIEYDLSEIVFSAKNQQEFETKKEKILNAINEIGFKTAANKFSISETSKFGGSIGKVKKNQLSKKIRNEIDKISIGEFTKPINLGSGFLIIKINNKKIITEEFDENKIVNEIINLERKKQFENFSQIYFSKIKLNTQINEF